MDARALLDEVERTLGGRFPDVEVVDVEVRGGNGPVATVYIDRPGGVDLDLCEQVARALEALRDRFALEVSSPGLDRPLRKPAHFAAAAGMRVTVKTVAPRDGRSVYHGRIARADETAVTLALDEGGSETIAYGLVARARVNYDFDANGGERE